MRCQYSLEYLGEVDAPTEEEAKALIRAKLRAEIEADLKDGFTTATQDLQNHSSLIIWVYPDPGPQIPKDPLPPKKEGT